MKGVIKMPPVGARRGSFSIAVIQNDKLQITGRLVFLPER